MSHEVKFTELEGEVEVTEQQMQEYLEDHREVVEKVAERENRTERDVATSFAAFKILKRHVDSLSDDTRLASGKTEVITAE